MVLDESVTLCWNIHVPPMGALLSHNQRKMECGEFSQTEKEMTNPLRERERERGTNRTCALAPALTVRAGSVYLAVARPYWEGRHHCAAPSCIVSKCDCVGCREFSQGLSCQCMEPSISPFLSFTAGSFLCSNTPSPSSPPPSHK